MNNKQIQSLIGQLDRVEQTAEELMNNNRLTEEEFQDICDCTATIITNFRVAKKRMYEPIQKSN